MSKEANNDSPTPFSGLGLIQEGQALAERIEGQSWVSPSLNSLSPGGGSGSFSMGPVELLSSLGASWLLDHLSPLKDWLDQLASDPTQTENFAQAWSSVADSLQSNADDLLRSIHADVSPLDGTTVSTYSDLQSDVAKHVDLAGTCSHALSTGLTVASNLVVTVHNTISEAIGEIVSSVVDRSDEFAVSLQTTMPKVITEVSSLSLEWANKMRRNLDDLLNSTQELAKMTKETEDLFKRLHTAMASVNGGNNNDPSSDSSPHSSDRVSIGESAEQENAPAAEEAGASGASDNAAESGSGGLGGGQSMREGIDAGRQSLGSLDSEAGPDAETDRGTLDPDDDGGRPFVPKGRHSL